MRRGRCEGGRGRGAARIEALEPRWLFSIIPVGNSIQLDNAQANGNMQMATNAAGAVVVAWPEGENLYFNLIDASGTELPAPVLINTSNPLSSAPPDPAGVTPAEPFAGAVIGRSPFDIAMDADGDFAVAWQEAIRSTRRNLTRLGRPAAAPLLFPTTIQTRIPPYRRLQWMRAAISRWHG